ncbi:MAG: recombination regulator RecX [Candidatus Omnitrophica bacterium]|nr:recombination regulator RecX [Candidatus Omnitrophota bacterium]
MLNKKSQREDPFQEAKNYCFLLLKFRLRSEDEIRRRLKKKRFNSTVIEKTLAFLRVRGFLDDRQFARSWLESRLKNKFGLRRIKQELLLKGIDKKIIDEQIEEIREGYSEEDLVAGLAQKRLNQLKDLDPQKAKRRLYSYLIRRGFSPERVLDVLNRLI